MSDEIIMRFIRFVFLMFGRIDFMDINPMENPIAKCVEKKYRPYRAFYRPVFFRYQTFVPTGLISKSAE